LYHVVWDEYRIKCNLPPVDFLDIEKEKYVYTIKNDMQPQMINYTIVNELLMNHNIQEQNLKTI